MFNAANRYQPKKVVASVWKRTKSRPYVRLTLLCLQPQNNYLHTPFNLATTTKYIYRKSGVFLRFSKSGRFCRAKKPLFPCQTTPFAMPNNRFWNAKA